jgi:hypothetical protein
MRRAALIAVLALSAACAGTAAGAGPSPGIEFGGNGIGAPTGGVRYVAVPARAGTVVEAIRDGRVLRWRWLQGSLGVPLVAYDGSAGGLSYDGRTLVLANFPGGANRSTTTRLAVLDTKNLRPRRELTLRGMFSFDAIAPDGSTIYLIEYTSTDDFSRYRVRAYDVEAQKLVPGAIVDKREPNEPMTGVPIARVSARDGSWVYTLYSRGTRKPFIHALDAVHRSAVCIDLDAWRGSDQLLQRLRLSLTSDARRLVLSRRDGSAVLTVATPR